MNGSVGEIIQSLTQEINNMKKRTLKQNSIDLFEVYEFAKEAHGRQKRKTGEDYITHPIAAAKIARDHGADKETIAACLLHDTIEDTDIKLEQLKYRFGKEITFLVDGVTNIGSEKESLAKTNNYAAQDQRVVLVRLADRIHNTRTAHNVEFFKKHYARTNVMYIELGKKFGYTSAAGQLESLTSKLSTNQD